MNMQFKWLAALALAGCAWTTPALACEGGVYLNPQVIRGEGTPQVAGAASELADFLARAGLSASPVINVSNLDETVAAVKRAKPPCWVFGNPVVGLASGYRPVAVNNEQIESAVLVLGEAGAAENPKPVELAKLMPEEQAQVLAKLRGASCFGIRSGVTTALVKAEGLCGKVVDVSPQTGLGQSYLPTKAAFEWRPGRWVGLVTRARSARSATMSQQIGADPGVHHARLIVVPTKHSSWGYGLYVRADVPEQLANRAAAQFAALTHPGASLARALDVEATFRFVTPRASDIDAMRVALEIAP